MDDALRASAEALLDEGHEADAVAAELGMTPAALEELLEGGGAPSSPAADPRGARRAEGYAPSRTAGDVREAGSESGREANGMGSVDLFIGERVAENARPAPSLRTVQLSRGAKVRLVAQAMAAIRRKSWHLLSPAERLKWARLADLAVAAVEVVEEAEGTTLGVRQGAHVGRHL